MTGQYQTIARFVTGLLLAATALIGVAHIAFLPPWEGYDETAHWSYIQELADTGHAPIYGKDELAADIAAYPGPMAYGGTPPFDKTARATYRSYRLAGAHALSGAPTHFVGFDTLNWQAQHPPLYYALMAPIYRAAHGLGWVDHLMVLRLASFALAFAGLVIGVFATIRLIKPPSVWTGPIMAAWPFLFPQFFPEFARLGNDSLCLLIVSVVWALLLRLLTGEGRWASHLLLGVALGLGLLTKAFFLPIGAGVAVMLAAHWQQGGRPRAQLGQAALAAIAALAIGAWWYVAKDMQTGSFTGSDEFIRFHQAGGLSRLVKAFSPQALIRGLGVIPGTFAWAGTWSLARLPEYLLIAPVLLLTLTLWGYVRRLSRADLIGWAPLALTLPFLAGLVYHVLVGLTGIGAATPGWYLHILAAPLGLAVARGWKQPRLLALLAALTAVYTAAGWAFQLSMFSGCAAKLGDNKHYDLTGAGCFIDQHALFALGHPLLGFVCLTAGVILAIVAASRAWSAFRASQVDFLPLVQP
jgi:hypothetical protein